jgi:hypothetical protein
VQNFGDLQNSLRFDAAKTQIGTLLENSNRHFRNDCEDICYCKKHFEIH